MDNVGIVSGMSIPSFMDATSFILRQQFHRDGNKIVDRTSDRSTIIPKADEIIKKALRIISSFIHLWEEGNREDFLNKISDFLVLPRDEVFLEVDRKQEALTEAEPEALVEYMTLAGAIFSLLRAKTAENLVEQIVTEFPAIIPLKDILLEKMAMKESLLANMAFLYKLAEITGFSLPIDYLQSEKLAAVERLSKQL